VPRSAWVVGATWTGKAVHALDLGFPDLNTYRTLGIGSVGQLWYGTLKEFTIKLTFKNSSIVTVPASFS
jgi:hypothetical protein